MFYKVKLSKFRTKSLMEFNKNLNSFFDIKTLIYLKESSYEIKRKAQYLSEDYKKYNLKSRKHGKKFIIKYKKFSSSKLKSHKSKRLVVKSLKFLKKKSIRSFFEYFLIHGSYASNDYIDGWSDLDTFVVISDDCLLNYKYLIKLRSSLKRFYKILLTYSPFQHHGLIFFSKADLLNYNNNLMPVEALKYNYSIINPKKNDLEINILSNKSISAKKSLKERLYYIKIALKDGYYQHHVFGNRKLKVPIEINDQSIKQFIAHVNYILNIPILFLSSIKKSSHKKASYKIFYKKIKNTEVERFIRKHEYFRKNWKKFKSTKKINLKILNYFGENYFNECKKTIEFILKKIESYTR